LLELGKNQSVTNSREQTKILNHFKEKIKAFQVI
jgi:hypothetical protein